MPSPEPTPIKRIAISTGGGDAPGLNAVIRAVTLSGLRHGYEMVGIRDGYNGLLLPERFPQGGVVALDAKLVEGITERGGTLLGTTNRGDPRQFPIKNAQGQDEVVDRTGELSRLIAAHGIDALITVGGDGSISIGAALARHGTRVIGVPKTIDNDLDGTVVTFGFDTAVSFAALALDRLQTTAHSHHRVMVVEVMGRYAGWIALHAGLAGSADAILIPEIPFELARVAELIEERERRGYASSIVVVAEGATAKGGTVALRAQAEPGRLERLGGMGQRVADELSALTRKETRTVVLGHLLRGGSPSAFDRVISLRFGAAAVRALADGKHGVMVALDGAGVSHVPLEDATRRMRKVPLDSDTVLTARDLGICLGD